MTHGGLMTFWGNDFMSPSAFLALKGDSPGIFSSPLWCTEVIGEALRGPGPTSKERAWGPPNSGRALVGSRLSKRAGDGVGLQHRNVGTVQSVPLAHHTPGAETCRASQSTELRFQAAGPPAPPAQPGPHPGSHAPVSARVAAAIRAARRCGAERAGKLDEHLRRPENSASRSPGSQRHERPSFAPEAARREFVSVHSRSICPAAASRLFVAAWHFSARSITAWTCHGVLACSLPLLVLLGVAQQYRLSRCLCAGGGPTLPQDDPSLADRISQDPISKQGPIHRLFVDVNCTRMLNSDRPLAAPRWALAAPPFRWCPQGKETTSEDSKREFAWGAALPADPQAPGGIATPPVYGQLLALYLLHNDMNNARYLWKRIPPAIKSANSELGGIWSVGQRIWQRDFPGVYTAIGAHQWSEAVQPIMEALRDATRRRAFALVSQAYTSILADDFAAFVGLPVEEAVKGILEQGWQADSTTRMVVPRKPVAGALDASFNRFMPSAVSKLRKNNVSSLRARDKLATPPERWTGPVQQGQGVSPARRERRERGGGQRERTGDQRAQGPPGAGPSGSSAS
ncbi:PREDICTED: COP9 signalosome complex subunit 8 [Condylura cristata]|uniref:COP9 signalosome complex subunit 8 n=1 Tax=Condylura cristata TaxID=143302 RepID=UPI000643B074|nr:PREDICTED: COP9 signalosome complex subunit 8 [Condylura cristata]